MKQVFLSVLLILVPMFVSAHDIEVANDDGVTIYYKWINNNTEVAVTYKGNNFYSFNGEYIGNIVIPKSIFYLGSNLAVGTDSVLISK